MFSGINILFYCKRNTCFCFSVREKNTENFFKCKLLAIKDQGTNMKAKEGEFRARGKVPVLFAFDR